MTKLLTATALIALFAITPIWAQQQPQQPTQQQQMQQQQQQQKQQKSYQRGSARERSGSVTPQARISLQEESRATTALNLLVANGYTQWSDFRKAGKDYEARAIRDGRAMLVRIDPDTHTVRPAS